MATITSFPFFTHVRSTATMHVLHRAHGRLRHDGPGAAFWFRPMAAAISEVPVDDREQPVLVTVRTADLQQVSAPGSVTFRVVDPELAAARVDFSVHLKSGQWAESPLETLGSAIHGAAAAAVAQSLADRDLRQALTTDPAWLASTVQTALAADERLSSIGIAVVGVRFAVLRAEPDIERALQTPAREAIQQEADKATFERRAIAVEREAAIGQNELANQIDLAARAEHLIAQKGTNARREAQEQAAAGAIATQAEASRTTALAHARADADRVTGEAAAETEKARLAAYTGVPRDLLFALAAHEAAVNLPAIDHLVITPDLVQSLLARLTQPDSHGGGIVSGTATDTAAQLRS
jgi:regulator of protease activity HflC (stomatin/prohibitin superfamily)